MPGPPIDPLRGMNLIESENKERGKTKLFSAVV